MCIILEVSNKIIYFAITGDHRSVTLQVGLKLDTREPGPGAPGAAASAEPPGAWTLGRLNYSNSLHLSM